MHADADTTGRASSFEPNSTTGTLIVALVLCLVCSLVVSSAAVSLKPMQDVNRLNKMRRNVFIAAGIWDPSRHTDADIQQLFIPENMVLVNLADPSPGAPAAGTLNTAIEAAGFDMRKAAKDPAQSIAIAPENDLAGISRRAKMLPVYLVKDDGGAIQTIVLPIYGKGLWSTMYGFLALEGDARTVKGITFYEHGETPGLGGEVENPGWKAKWPGKIAVDENGELVLDMTKPGYANAPNEIDGLSGATITSNGVENMIRYWLGPDGFGPYLDTIRSAAPAQTAAAP